MNSPVDNYESCPYKRNKRCHVVLTVRMYKVHIRDMTKCMFTRNEAYKLSSKTFLCFKQISLMGMVGTFCCLLFAMLLVPKKRKLEDSKKVEKEELKIKEEPLSESSNSQDEKELTLMAQGATINFRRLQNFLRSFPLSNADMLTKKANCKLETVVDKNEWKDLSELQAEFRFCYKNASALKHVSLFFAIQRVFDFMSLDEASITFHYAYPKAPISAYHLFVRKLGGGKPLFLETSKRFKDDSDPLVIECKREAKKNKERFYTELRDFKERYHDELSSVHIKALENKLNTYERANLKREDRVSTGSKTQTVEKRKTAFDFYKLSKKHTLLELPPEEREAIFCRNFDELDSKVKNIFELLEANSD